MQAISNPYINNNLLNDDVIHVLCQDTSASREWYDFLKNLYTIQQPESSLTKQSDPENTLCNIWLAPILEKLGWHYPAQQEILSWIAKDNKIDFSLYASKEECINRQSYPLTFLEAKKYNEKLNKHYDQTMRYIRALRGKTGRAVVFGFLSNGQDWWYCANFGEREGIARCEIKLLDLIQAEYTQETARALAVFTSLFGAAYHQSGQAEQDGKKSENYQEQVKEDVRYIVTGVPFETIGKRIFSYISENNIPDFPPTANSLKEIYHHTLTLAFRLIFQAYIEAKNPQLLDTDIHPTYCNYSLTHFYAKNLGWLKLRKNFQTLDNGDPAENMPVFNGGLFANKNTPLLDAENLFDDQTIHHIVGQFLYRQPEENDIPIPVDYAGLEIQHFSEIYEELLQFEFRIAEGQMYHIPTQQLTGPKNKLISQEDIYADAVDWAHLKAEYKDLIYTQIPEGQLYFTSKTLSRKASASYYTPKELTSFMCKTAIKEALNRAVNQGKSILDIKILDNACGSGHFLTQALDTLFNEIKERDLQNDSKLQKQLEEDTSLARESVAKIRYNQPIDTDTVLKRLLLKHCIYGVDMNRFAVEIARASLWLDTFTFGVPLAFIEHHIVTGNSLVGEIGQTVKKDGKDQLALFQNDYSDIQKTFEEINNISDMTGTDAKRSHELYDAIRDKLHEQAKTLNDTVFEEFQQVLAKPMKKKDSTIKAKYPFVHNTTEFARWFLPFHYWLIFPELWDSEKNTFIGFDLVIGNPPWDKVKFEEPAFFAQYHANYRTLNDTDKKAVRTRVLNLPGIQKSYELTQGFLDSQRLFYPTIFQYAHGSGGDQNLFRYFIERNLGLLAPQGILCYLTPSAWSYEQSSQKLRSHLWRHYHVHYFIQFENKGLFKNIDDRYKFAAFMLSADNETQDFLPALFLQRDPFILQRLLDEGFHLTLNYPTSLIRETQGETLLELKSAVDLSIIAKIRQNALLKTGLTQHYIHFVNDFHMTNDVAAHFGEYFFDSPAGLAEPRQLVEAKYFHQFNVNHQTKDFNHHPRYYDAVQIRTYPKLKNRIQEQGCCDADYPRLAWRAIASNTNERTSIFFLLSPESLAGHSVWISTPTNLAKTLFIQAIGNSLVIDYLARQNIDINVTKILVDTLPFPQPGSEEILTQPLYREVTRLSALLSLGYAHNTPKQQEMAFLQDFLLEHHFYEDKEVLQSNIPDTDDKRWHLQARLDIFVARDIYGLTLQEMDYIIPHYFPQWEKTHAFHVNLVKAWWTS